MLASGSEALLSMQDGLLNRGDDDVELGLGGDGRSVERFLPNDGGVVLARASWMDVIQPHFTHVFLVVAVVLLGAIVFCMDDPQSRGWALIGLLSYTASHSWGSVMHLVKVFKGQQYLRIQITSQRSLMLCNAITHKIVCLLYTSPSPRDS